MSRYWTSKKQRPVVDERRDQLDLLVEFANADLTQKEGDRLKSRIHDLLSAVMVVYSQSPPNLISAGKVDLAHELQKHLRARLKKIIYNTKFLVEMPLWKMSGSIEFTVEAKINRFHERLHLRRLKPGNELKELKRMVDLAFIEITRDLDFKPNRFRQCPRCGNFYYQPTEKKSIYCSIRCGNAVRLQQFRKERRGKD